MPQTVSNLPLQPSQSSGALWLKAMCDALWLTAMCDALWLKAMCDALWLTAMCDTLWLTAMCDALWLTAMCDALWLTAMGLISLHISSLATENAGSQFLQPSLNFNLAMFFLLKLKPKNTVPIINMKIKGKHCQVEIEIRLKELRASIFSRHEKLGMQTWP
ncbi:hypothetical protein M8J77_014219 [Diaphorina citri]|nr:hypothetical protein M8J77_014219 [Diaphorina citri]